MKATACRRAFSLAELLIVIGILTITLGLIIPAIQKARETVNKMICANNLRQIGTAAHHCHTDRSKLPPGYLGPSLANDTNRPAFYYEGQWIGHLPMLLPYLEQESVCRQIQVDFNPNVVSPVKWWWNATATGPGPPNIGNYTAAMQDIKVFRCPSAVYYAPEFNNPSPTGGGTTLGFHVFNSVALGPFTADWRDEYGSAAKYRPLGRTNYVGVAGCGSGNHPFFSKYEGIYTNRSKYSLGQIIAQDGTSNTLLYGEVCGSHWNSPSESKDIAWMAGGGLGTYLGLERARNALLIQFSSYHPTGVQFCFADCSVRTIRFGMTKWSKGMPFSADWRILQQLAGFKDGENADVSALME